MISRFKISILTVVFFTVLWILIMSAVSSIFARSISGFLAGLAMVLILYLSESKHKKSLAFLISVLVFLSYFILFLNFTSTSYLSLIVVGLISIYFFYFFSRSDI